MFEDTNGQSFTNTSSTANPNNLPSLLAKAGLFLVVAAFFQPDFFVYPFKASGPGPGGLYGTWTGIVRTTPAATRGFTQTFKAQGEEVVNHPEPVPAFVAVAIHIRPVLSASDVEFMFRPSNEMAGSVDVYLPDGTHQHCTSRLGAYGDGHFELLVHNPGQDLEATNEATVTASHLTFTSGMCPVPGAQPFTFSGALQRGSNADIPALVAQIPAHTAEVAQRTAIQNAALAGEWAGPVAAWDRDYQPTQPGIDAAIRLTFTPVPGHPGTYTGQGELHHAWGWKSAITIPSFSFSDSSFDTRVTSTDPDEGFPENGGLGATLTGDTLDLKGALFMLQIAGPLHRATNADYNRAVAALPRLKPGRYPGPDPATRVP